MMEYILSIIIPHKNIPELLIRCLKSIPKREDVQIIVVDDGSQCDTKKILVENGFGYIEYYQNVLEHGVGPARNIALANAKGKWITCLDADDFLCEPAGVIIDSLSERNDDVDVVYCAGNSVDSDYYSASDRTSALNAFINMHSFNQYEAEMRLRYTFGEPWCKIVRLSMIQKFNKYFVKINDYIKHS